MSATMEDILSEGLRLARAQERVGSLLNCMTQQSDMIDEVLEVAPDLGPEMNAMRQRLQESLAHMTAALTTIQAKVELL